MFEKKKMSESTLVEDASSSENEENISQDSEIYKDLTKLKPYEFEPLASSSDEDANENEIKNSRKGKINWCQCACCKSMTNEMESLCCKEANEISDELFEG